MIIDYTCLFLEGMTPAVMIKAWKIASFLLIIFSSDSSTRSANVHVCVCYSCYSFKLNKFFDKTFWNCHGLKRPHDLHGLHDLNCFHGQEDLHGLQNFEKSQPPGLQDLFL